MHVDVDVGEVEGCLLMQLVKLLRNRLGTSNDDVDGMGTSGLTGRQEPPPIARVWAQLT